MILVNLLPSAIRKRRIIASIECRLQFTESLAIDDLQCEISLARNGFSFSDRWPCSSCDCHLAHRKVGSHARICMFLSSPCYIRFRMMNFYWCVVEPVGPAMQRCRACSVTMEILRASWFAFWSDWDSVSTTIRWISRGTFPTEGDFDDMMGRDILGSPTQTFGDLHGVATYPNFWNLGRFLQQVSNRQEEGGKEEEEWTYITTMHG